MIPTTEQQEQNRRHSKIVLYTIWCGTDKGKFRILFCHILYQYTDLAVYYVITLPLIRGEAEFNGGIVSHRICSLIF